MALTSTDCCLEADCSFSLSLRTARSQADPSRSKQQEGVQHSSLQVASYLKSGHAEGPTWKTRPSPRALRPGPLAASSAVQWCKVAVCARRPGLQQLGFFGCSPRSASELRYLVHAAARTSGCQPQWPPPSVSLRIPAPRGVELRTKGSLPARVLARTSLISHPSPPNRVGAQCGTGSHGSLRSSARGPDLQALLSQPKLSRHIATLLGGPPHVFRQLSVIARTTFLNDCELIRIFMEARGSIKGNVEVAWDNSALPLSLQGRCCAYRGSTRRGLGVRGWTGGDAARATTCNMSQPYFVQSIPGSRPSPNPAPLKTPPAVLDLSSLTKVKLGATSQVVCFLAPGHPHLPLVPQLPVLGILSLGLVQGIGIYIYIYIYMWGRSF